MIEENVFANAFNPEGSVHREWRSELADDLRKPTLKGSIREAITRRLRRVYLPLLSVLGVAVSNQPLRSGRTVVRDRGRTGSSGRRRRHYRPLVLPRLPRSDPLADLTAGQRGVSCRGTRRVETRRMSVSRRLSDAPRSALHRTSSRIHRVAFSTEDGRRCNTTSDDGVRARSRRAWIPSAEDVLGVRYDVADGTRSRWNSR